MEWHVFPSGVHDSLSVRMNHTERFDFDNTAWKALVSCFDAPIHPAFLARDLVSFGKIIVCSWLRMGLAIDPAPEGFVNNNVMVAFDGTKIGTENTESGTFETFDLVFPVTFVPPFVRLAYFFRYQFCFFFDFRLLLLLQNYFIFLIHWHHVYLLDCSVHHLFANLIVSVSLKCSAILFSNKNITCVQGSGTTC